MVRRGKRTIRIERGSFIDRRACALRASTHLDASEAESDGFFDWEDAPPWDAWVALYKDEHGQDVLLSWVPPQLLEAAARGIWANPVDCMGWLDGRDLPIAEALHSHGLL